MSSQENPALPSRPTLDPLKSMVLAWGLFAGWLAFSLIDKPQALVMFPLLIPLAMLIFLAHETASPKQGAAAAWIAMGLSLAVPVLQWNAIQWQQTAIFALNLALAAWAVGIGEEAFEDLVKKTSGLRTRIAEAGEGLKTLSQQNQFYTQRLPHLKSQIGIRQSLYSFSREIGTLLDPEKIKQKLIEKAQALFPNERVALSTSGLPADAVERWVSEKKNSLLIRDTYDDKANASLSGLTQDELKFLELKSVMAVPLVIGRKTIGLLRVDSGAAGRFVDVDLEQLELYAHLSTLALENAQLFEKINALATRDGLTGLATHRVFQDKLTEEINRAARYHAPMSLAMIDIDHFKSVNDRFGHLVGDQVLKAVAQTIAQACRPVDFAARYGGEEFAFILPEVNLKDAFRMAETLRRNIAQYPVPISGQGLKITVSIGCAAFPQDAQTAPQLIRAADQRLYKAKNSGRNKAVME